MLQSFYVPGQVCEQETGQPGGQPQTFELTATLGVIWEKCFAEKLCVRIPFDGRKCTPEVRGCVRLLVEGGRFYVELELLGQRVRREIGNACFELKYGIGKLKVCLSGIDLSGGRLRSITIRADVCIGDFGIEKCWKVYEDTIRFLLLTEGGDVASALGLTGGDVYAYVESGTSDEE